MAGVAPWHEQTILKHYLPVKAQFLSGKLLTFWKNCLPFGKTVYLSVKVHYLPVKGMSREALPSWSAPAGVEISPLMSTVEGVMTKI